VTRNAESRWQFAPVPVRVANEVEAQAQLRNGKDVFLVVTGSKNATTGGTHHQVAGVLRGSVAAGWTAEFAPIEMAEPPVISQGGVYLGFKGATLTAKAFDRTLPGIGKWVVPATAWLFAFSTMISWSYYGEQGVVYMFRGRGVMLYRVIYCLLIVVAASPLISTENELDILSTLGTGVMLWSNIPIMLIFGPMAMKAYHEYMGKLKRGEFKGRAYPKITSVAAGDDVE
jgi:AGCS family alanine or glycine:cation symporter